MFKTNIIIMFFFINLNKNYKNVLNPKHYVLIMETKKLNQEVIDKVSEWLKGHGENELNEIANKESETDTYIKSMSKVDSEHLKIPYSLL